MSEKTQEQPRAPMTPEGLEAAGAALARRAIDRFRPIDADVVDLMGPNLRRGYELELERLGVCSPDAHVWEAGRVTHSSPGVILAVRRLGKEIEACQRCHVWRDKGEKR